MRAWPELADAVLAVVLAPRCAACDGLLDRPMAGPVCAACWAAVRPFTPPLCGRCGDPLPSWRALSRGLACCPRCRRRPGAVDEARSFGPYEGALRRIIHAFKYGGRRTLAVPLGALLRNAADVLGAGADMAVPVPLHPRRLRARGFNQAADLAGRLGLPVADALCRRRPTAPQAGLQAARRHRNVRGAFDVRRSPLDRWLAPPTARPWRGSSRTGLAGRRVLLVDDVVTTGATLDACARILKAAGAREVRAVTLARVAAARS